MVRFVLLALLLLVAASARAAPAPEPKVYRIEPKALAQAPSVKAAVMKGTADAEGHRYLLSNLNTLQPILVSLEGVNPGDEFTLTVYKEGWKEPKREASTRDGGVARVRFRTYGDAHLRVASSSGSKPYQLLVTIGPELRPPIAPVFVPMPEYRQRHPMSWLSWSSPAAWGIGGGLLLAFGAATFFFLRRRRAA
jgi:hypothetical protein